MPNENTGKVASAAEKIGRPAAEELGLSLWDVEYVKEGTSWYLRYYIDKDAGVTIDDCENFSRRVDELLDESDLIGRSYILEVSSPGTERELKKPWHFQSAEGKKIRIRLIRPDENGRKELVCVLKRYEDGRLTVEEDGACRQIDRSGIAFVRMYDDFTDIGGIN